MSSSLISAGVFGLGAALIAALLVAIPLKTIATLTTPFSLKTFGIRRIKRWHSHTDTLANFMLWISVLFCLAAPWIPYSPIIYIVWLIFTWLCATSRAVRMTQVRSRNIKTLVIYLVNLVFLCGLFAASGLSNKDALWIGAFRFANGMLEGQALEPTFYLTDTAPAAYIFQELILILPLVNLWGQFKYMRLENTFKGSNIGTYCVKAIIVALVLVCAGSFGPAFVEGIYQKPILEAEKREQIGYPMSREDLHEAEPEPETTPETPAEPEQPAEQPAPNPEEQPADPNNPEAVNPEEGVNPEAAPVEPQPEPVPYQEPVYDPGVEYIEPDPNAGVDVPAVVEGQGEEINV